METAASDCALRTVTVIMPIRNEGPFIGRSLGAVLAQDYPRELMEILLVDGHSTDRTREEVRAVAGARPDVRVLDNPAGIVAAGLNLALAEARGEVIVRIDGHCEVPRHYVRACVRHLVEDRVDGVGGAVRTLGDTPVGRAIATAMSCRFGVGDSAFRTTRGISQLTDTVAFPAYTREAINRAGPFDEELVRNQDDEYNYRLRSMGARVLLAGDVESIYHGRTSLRRLCRQYFEYGYWKVRVMQKHPRQMRARQFAPALLVASLALGSVLAAVSTMAAAATALVVAAYLAATATASIIQARRDWRLAPWLPPAFITLHLAYGLGFLTGLVAFRRRWRDGSLPEVSTATGDTKRTGR
jgi:glycosyltransferase involved in cell wall biosynthesis